MPWPPKTSNRTVGSGTQTLSDLEEAVDELEDDTESLKQLIYGGTTSPQLVIHTTTDW